MKTDSKFIPIIDNGLLINHRELLHSDRAEGVDFRCRNVIVSCFFFFFYLCRDVFSCAACGVVDKPSRKMQLEVFLSCSSSSHWTVKVKVRCTVNAVKVLFQSFC